MSEAVQPSSGDPIPQGAGRVNAMSIAGVGAVTGYGWGAKHLWDGFLLGESAVKLVNGLDGYVDGGQAYLSLIADEGDRNDGPSRFMRAARFAAREAITDALERGWKPGPVVGLVHSLEAGDIETWSEFYRSGESRVRPKKWVNMLPSTVLSQLMKENDFHGPTMSVSADVRKLQCGNDHGEIMARYGYRVGRHPAGHRSLRRAPGAPAIQRPRRRHPQHAASRSLPSLPGG